MSIRTKIDAKDGRQDLMISREFELPVELLFRAYSEPDLIGQWMGTKVLKHESKIHGSYRFETSDGQGNVVFSANGVIHEFLPNEKMTRTFEMDDSPFGVQLEFLEFERITDDSSKLNIHVIYKSNELRDQMLKLPFEFGINMAHNRLQEIVNKLR